MAQLSTPAPLTGEASVRWTPGAALRADGVPQASGLQDTSRAVYQRFSDSVVLVHKRDAVTPAAILDRERRMGGWGAVAAEVGRQLGGEWTARSVRTLAGTLRCGIRSRIRRVNVLLPHVPRLSVVERALESRVEVA